MMDYIVWIFYALIAILVARTEIVFRIRSKQLNIISNLADEAIARGDKWCYLFDDFKNKPSYDDLLFNFRVWTHKQAYPSTKAKP